METIDHTNMFQRAIATPLRVGSAYTARTSLRPPSRYLHASPIASNTATEKVADVADKVCVSTPSLSNAKIVRIVVAIAWAIG